METTTELIETTEDTATDFTIDLMQTLVVQNYIVIGLLLILIIFERWNKK